MRPSLLDYLKASVEIAMEIHVKKGVGDILVFLSSQEEIEIFIETISNYQTRGLLVLPLYASLPLDKQMAAFQKSPKGESNLFFYSFFKKF